MQSMALEKMMPYAKIALLLLVAFAIPSAVQALGLGEIHVNSALNEAFAAEVDIVGATPEDLAAISASVADPATFLRFGFDRPAFLSSAVFKIATDSKGRPVLAIRSTDAFTEPLINMLIDLRWRNGELIRQYTLLLDPAMLPPETRVARAAATDSGVGAQLAPADPGHVATPHSAWQATTSPATARSSVGGAEIVEVTAGATLRRIASRVSTRGDGDLERLMVAIFRGNPNAFVGNINRLRLGAILRVPPLEEVSKLSEDDAHHEMRIQMDAWRVSAKLASQAEPVAHAVAMRHEAAPQTSDNAIDAPGSHAEASDDSALVRRVQALAVGLAELQRALKDEQELLASLQARVSLTDATPSPLMVPPQAHASHAIGAFLAAAVIIASVVVLGLLYARFGRRTLIPTPARADAKIQAPRETNEVVRPSVTQTLPDRDTTSDAAPLDGTNVDSLHKLERPVPVETALDADTAKLHYLLLDPERAVHHVPMPSALHEKAVFKERRTSLVDALKVAVEREPQRLDLRVKLLETYYAAAATSRAGFLEVARILAGERANMAAGEWGKIANMGRQIGAENELFDANATYA
jgi:pilus assembly protein FimV